MMSFELFRPPVRSRNPHPEGNANQCGNEHPTGWSCTRRLHHYGRHEAGLGEGDGVAYPELIAASWAR